MQLLVHRHDLFVGGSQFFIGRLQFGDGFAQIVLRFLQIAVEPVEYIRVVVGHARGCGGIFLPGGGLDDCFKEDE